MSTISGVNSSTYSYAAGMVSGQVDAGKNPAGVTIDEGAKAQITGTQVGTDNAARGKDMLNVADGALEGISDMLTRMREIAVKASNTAVYSDSDRKAMQAEVEQLKQGIADSTKNTEFNTKKLFDGSLADVNLATNPDGSGMSIQFEDTSLDTLGIKDFDVTKDFDIKTIDDAIDMVSKSRSSVGARTSALDSTMRYNTSAAENLNSLTDSLEDVDVEKYISDRNKKQLLDLYSMYSKKMDMHSQESFINKMFGN
jgi:flagellin